MRTAHLIALVAIAVLLSACWKERNWLVCCTSEQSCERFGDDLCYEDGPQGFCACKSDTVCDNATNRCVAPDQLRDCDDQHPCTGAALQCVDGTCRGCDPATAAGCTPAAPVCGAEFACGACDGAEDCQPYAAQPFCLTGSCVGCRDSADCATPATPACDPATHACRICRAHTECGSGVCDTDTGACAAESNIAYVTFAGAPGACTRDAPCATLTQGLAANRPFIHVAASAAPYKEPATVRISGRAVLVAGAGATITPLVNGDVALEVSGAARVVVDGLRIASAGTTDGHGIVCKNDLTMKPTMILRGVTIANNGGKGIDATSCAFTVERSTIVGNSGGGVSLVSSSYAIRNSFIVGNGGLATDFGGFRATGAAAGSIFEFNTVSANGSSPAFAQGVQCSTATGPVRITNNIVYDNPKASATSLQVAGTNCVFTYSIIGPRALLDGDGSGNNTSADPLLVPDSESNSFHLRPGSPAIDNADPASTLEIDFDGQARTTRRDIGADELLP